MKPREYRVIVQGNVPRNIKQRIASIHAVAILKAKSKAADTEVILTGTGSCIDE